MADVTSINSTTAAITSNGLYLALQAWLQSQGIIVQGSAIVVAINTTTWNSGSHTDNPITVSWQPNS